MLGVADGVAAWAEQVMNRRILSFFCRVHVCGLDLFVNFCRPGVNYPCLPEDAFSFPKALLL